MLTYSKSFPCPPRRRNQRRWIDGPADALEWFIYQEWSDRRANQGILVSTNGWNADEAAKCFTGSPTKRTPARMARSKRSNTLRSGLNSAPKAPVYRKKLNDIEGRSKKRRVAHCSPREVVRISYRTASLSNEGKNPMGDGILPLVKYATTPDMKEWFGIGAIRDAGRPVYHPGFEHHFRSATIWRRRFSRPSGFGIDIMAGRPRATSLRPPLMPSTASQRAPRIQEAVWVDVYAGNQPADVPRGRTGSKP
jgi:hypothetical protein